MCLPRSRGDRRHPTGRPGRHRPAAPSTAGGGGVSSGGGGHPELPRPGEGWMRSGPAVLRSSPPPPTLRRAPRPAQPPRDRPRVGVRVERVRGPPRPPPPYQLLLQPAQVVVHGPARRGPATRARRGAGSGGEGGWAGGAGGRHRGRRLPAGQSPQRAAGRPVRGRAAGMGRRRERGGGLMPPLVPGAPVKASDGERVLAWEPEPARHPAASGVPPPRGEVGRFGLWWSRSCELLCRDRHPSHTPPKKQGLTPMARTAPLGISPICVPTGAGLREGTSLPGQRALGHRGGCHRSPNREPRPPHMAEPRSERPLSGGASRAARNRCRKFLAWIYFQNSSFSLEAFRLSGVCKQSSDGKLPGCEGHRGCHSRAPLRDRVFYFRSETSDIGCHHGQSQRRTCEPGKTQALLYHQTL